MATGRLRSEASVTYTPQHVANYFLDRAEAERRPITQLKLLKLVYMAYGWHLALTGQRLFDERIQAWKHGPVIQTLYDEFKSFGKSAITRRSHDFDLDTLDLYTPQIREDDEGTRLILDRVWEAYKAFDAWTLRQKTHEPDSPWSRVYIDGQRHIFLRDSDIREHYAQRIRQYLNAAKSFHAERAA